MNDPGLTITPTHAPHPDHWVGETLASSALPSFNLRRARRERDQYGRLEVNYGSVAYLRMISEVRVAGSIISSSDGRDLQVPGLEQSHEPASDHSFMRLRTPDFHGTRPNVSGMQDGVGPQLKYLYTSCT